MKTKFADMFLDYFNNYLTVELFAEHNQLTVDQARRVLKVGAYLHEQRAAKYKRRSEVD